MEAINLDPNSIEALQEAAHFFDAVLPDSANAKRYAAAAKEQCQKVFDEMNQILAER